MPTSQNGWPALDAGSPSLYIWTIPTKEGDVHVRLRNGSAGFLLCHFALWWAEKVEPIYGKVVDDWGYAWRPIRGQVSGLSNHASGTAIDLNATRHPLGTLTLLARQVQLVLVRTRIYGGALRWGGAYVGRKDQMHAEVNAPLSTAEKVARRLMETPRGRRILDANPGQRRVILS